MGYLVAKVKVRRKRDVKSAINRLAVELALDALYVFRGVCAKRDACINDDRNAIGGHHRSSSQRFTVVLD